MQEIWHTFFPRKDGDLRGSHFSSLEALSEERFPPGAAVPRRVLREAEIITYVREGTVAHADSMGHAGVVHAGKFQCLSAGTGIARSEANASSTEWAHVFQIWITPRRPDLPPSLAREHFSVAQRRGGLRVVASPDARHGSLRIQQDALVFSAVLDPGKHVIHELTDGRSAWLHIVQGKAALGETVLTTGDGIGITRERALSLTARDATEILLVDLLAA